MHVCWTFEEEMFCIFFVGTAGWALRFVDQFEFVEVSV